MKNRKIILILSVVAVILLGGFTYRAMQDVKAEVKTDTYNVVIKYQYMEGNGDLTLFDTYINECVKGEQIYIKSPDYKGWTPDKKIISTVVNNDIHIKVTYTCLHEIGYDTLDVECTSSDHKIKLCCSDCGLIFTEASNHTPIESLGVVLEYPTSEKVGRLQRTCNVCEFVYEEEFTTLTRTVTFGGDVLKNLKNFGDSYQGYVFSENGLTLVLQKQFLPELDIIFKGIENFDGSKGLSGAATASVSYDKAAWNNADIVYKASPEAPAISDADFSFRFGNAWRIIFGYEGRNDGSIINFILSSECPLKTSPLTITLTYDYTYTE